MATRIVDLSVYLENFAFEFHPAEITYWEHNDFGRRTARVWGLDTAEYPEPHVGGALEEVKAMSHAGTHLDAPWHFGPLTEGKPGKTIDQVPLEWCYGDGVVLDFVGVKQDGEYIDVPDIKAALERINYTLRPGDIVLFKTGAGAYWGKPDYTERGSGLTAESVFWLFEQGIRVMTTDAFTLDIPIPRMVEKLKGGDKEGFFPVHRAGRKVEYLHAEKVVIPDDLPTTGFKVCLFPIKIRRGSGAWCRAVAIIEE